MCSCLSGVKGVNSERVISNCDITYEVLQEIDLKVIQLLKVDKNDTTFKEFNKLLRKWINELNTTCPDSLEFQVVKNYVENEYTKLN